jgi:hypothetical protein
MIAQPLCRKPRPAPGGYQHRFGELEHDCKLKLTYNITVCLQALDSKLQDEVFTPIERWHKQYQQLKVRSSGSRQHYC